MGLPRPSDKQLGALRAIGDKGMEPVATALSRLLGTVVCLSACRVHADIARIMKAAGGPERPAIGVHVRILGDFRGGILIVFSPAGASMILEKLLGRETGGEGALTELEASALREVGNILSSAYLRALGEMLGSTLVPSVPILYLDRARAVVDSLLVEGAKIGDVSPMIETELAVEDGAAWGHVFLLPNHPSLDIILPAIARS